MEEAEALHVVRYGGETYDVVEDLGLLLLLRRSRRARRSFRRRRCVLADRDHVRTLAREEAREKRASAEGRFEVPVELLRSEVYGCLGCARCVANCAAVCRGWRSASRVAEFALEQQTRPTPCGHDSGALRAKAILVATARSGSFPPCVASRRVLAAVEDGDPRVRACALRAAKELRLFVPLERLSEALYDDWKARRNAPRYQKWHDALKPAIDKEDWQSYEKMVSRYAAVHEAGQRAALDVCGAAFLDLDDRQADVSSVQPPPGTKTNKKLLLSGQGQEQGQGQQPQRQQQRQEQQQQRQEQQRGRRLPGRNGETFSLSSSSSETSSSSESSAFVAGVLSNEGRSHPKKRRAELVEFMASLMSTYSQRRVAKDAVAKWDPSTSAAFVEAVVDHLFASDRYRRRTNAQHQAIVDVATPARGCGPALAVAILRHLDGDDLQRRLAARHALQIVVDCHAHRVSFITHHLVPACVKVADRTDWSQILHHVYHFCVPSWHAVYASLKHAVFCASVAIAVGAALAAGVAVGNVLVCGCKGGGSAAAAAAQSSHHDPAGESFAAPFLSAESSSSFASGGGGGGYEDLSVGGATGDVEGLSLGATAASSSMPLSLATPCLAFLDLHWLNSCLGADGFVSGLHQSQASALFADAEERRRSSDYVVSPFQTPTTAPDTTKTTTDTDPHRGAAGAAAGVAQDDGFTWTEVALMVMYSLFLPFLLVLHLVWLVDDFLCELQFLHCSRPFRDACVTGLLASIGP